MWQCGVVALFSSQFLLYANVCYQSSLSNRLVPCLPVPFPPVPTYYHHQKHYATVQKTIKRNFLSFSFGLLEVFSYICTVFRKRHKTYCSILCRIATSKENRRANQMYIEAALLGAGFTIVHLGLVASLAEIWRACAFCVRHI